jgi:hypothetical protein
VRVSVYFEGETVWLTQKAMAELFGVTVPAIAKHLKNVFDSGELLESSVVSILETTASDGKSYMINHYSLDANHRGWLPVRQASGYQSRVRVPADVPAVSTKVGRNDPSPCGSGKKYKRCHGG